MQLRRFVVAGSLSAAALLAAAGQARAQVAEVNTTHSLFYESPTRTHMFVYTPGADVQVAPTSWLQVRGGWEADVVSGASVSVKAGQAYATNHPGADVISTASVHDFRNVGHGGFTLKHDNVDVTAGYSYSTEHDYRSNSFNVSARTDQFDHNTQFEIAYARNFDQVCDRVQGSTDNATRRRALEDSTGCFTDSLLRTTHDISVDAFQGSWAQSWTPTFLTQLTYTGEIVNGFQSNPYRSVIIGEGLKAQENEPTNRARQSVSARAAFYLRPLKAALRFTLRGYYDTWDIKSGTAEVEVEKYLGQSLRVMLRGRAYKQTGAVFWSDDYTGGPVGPRGQYFTGDREVSPFYSLLGGVRAIYTVAPSPESGQNHVLGIFQQIRLGVSFDLVVFHYDEYTLGGLPVENARALMGAATLTAVF